uniref:NADH dehydrogenase subunit 2 n=1 Tax=Macrogyrodactylus karibae TaxID=696689 RepID=A0A2Z4GPK1_9PLAT|nr:NADH dehydrogenase subunit 2 [Macrogyrodactylus karibae]
MNALFINCSLFFICFSIILSLTSNNILMFWLLLELSSFFLVFVFLNDKEDGNVQFASFIFYLFSGISSILVVSGAFFVSEFLLLSGLLIKFFLFPFLMVLFYIFNNVSWFLIFVIGSLFKGFIFCLTYFFYFNNILLNNINIFICLLSWFVLGYYLLNVTLNLKGLWFIINLNSSITLYLSCFLLSNSEIFYLFFVYITLSVINIYLLYFLSVSFSNNVNNLQLDTSIFFLISLVGFPVSLNIIYKIISGFFLYFFCSWLLLLFWLCYVIAETLYLFFFFSSYLEKVSLYY